MPAGQPEVDPTTMMLGALIRRVHIWEQMLASPGVPIKTKQQIADEVLYLYSAMTELAEKPAAQPSANGNPPAPIAKDATGATSSPLTAEDQAEFERIRQRRANPSQPPEANGAPADTPPPNAIRLPASTAATNGGPPPPAPPVTLGKNVTGSTSSPLTAEDLADFERIRQKRGTPSQP